MQQGESSEPAELAEFFGFAEALRLAVFATNSREHEAVIVRATHAFGELVGMRPEEFRAMRLADLLSSGTLGFGRADLVDTELRHVDGRAVAVCFTRRQLGIERPRWIWLVFPREPSRQSVAALAQQLVHEVSNPLTSVVCRLDLVSRQLPQVILDQGRGEDLGRHLASAQQGAERVITLVREFADSLNRTPGVAEPADTVDVPSNAHASLAPDSGTLPPSSHCRSKRA